MNFVTRFSQWGRLLTGLLLLGAVVTMAAGAGDIKSRMRERLPKIIAMKQQGILGESNTGFLAVRKPDPAAKALAENENGDRWTVYRAIAKQQKTTPELVAKRRGLQNYENAAKGEWVQDSSGGWTQK